MKVNIEGFETMDLVLNSFKILIFQKVFFKKRGFLFGLIKLTSVPWKKVVIG